MGWDGWVGGHGYIQEHVKNGGICIEVERRIIHLGGRLTEICCRGGYIIFG